MRKFSKLNFISSPTPFHDMKNLQNALNVKPRLFIKRDDLTEVGLGGNKNRKLDYVMAYAAKNGADAVVTWGGLQSNHCRQTLAYAVILGMECHLILNGEKAEQSQGNLLIYEIFGAKLHFEPDSAKCTERCGEVAGTLSKEGKRPYIIPIGASTPLGSLGYIDCAAEIAEQSKTLGIKAEHIFCATGSSGTQAGLEVGARLYLPGCKVHGVSVSRSSAQQSEMVADSANKVAEFIGEDLSFRPEDIIIHDEYYGGQYALPTRDGIEAIKLLGRTQAILLDPVYSGKAMSGMLDLLKKGVFDEAGSVIFIHTGGFPAVFHFSENFRENAF